MAEDDLSLLMSGCDPMLSALDHQEEDMGNHDSPGPSVVLGSLTFDEVYEQVVLEDKEEELPEFVVKLLDNDLYLDPQVIKLTVSKPDLFLGS